jgi:para-nitrobenzyl esterase
MMCAALSILAACAGPESQPDAGLAPDASSTDGGADDGGSPRDAGCQFPTPGPDVVVTEQGAVRGSLVDGGLEFLGLPFAAPPTGERRFRPPEALQCWPDARPATTYPAACAQKGFDQFSDAGVVLGDEDCLFLNIWTPALTGSRPVLVFLHGGGNQQGSTSQLTGGARLYEGRALATRQDVVVVTAQYRLGPFGFLVVPGLSPGNLGLLDQAAALRWVKAHAARFGGDPSRVMLFGESAGALDTCLHLVMPGSRGLFSRALMESGGCVADSLAEGTAAGEAYVREVGCEPNDGGAACLAERTLDELLAPIEPAVSGGLVGLGFGPVIDGDGGVLPEHPALALAAGRHAQVPLVVGANADEMSVTAPKVVSPAMLELLYAKLPPGSRDAARALYPPGTTNAEARQSYVGMLSDAQFVCPARNIATAMASTQAEPVYRYFFSHSLAGLQGLFGAFHGLELFFVFGALERSEYAAVTGLRPSDVELLGAVPASWAAFAATGNPSTPGVTWPAYSPAVDSFLELTSPPAAGQGVRTAKCDFWDSVAATP